MAKAVLKREKARVFTDERGDVVFPAPSARLARLLAKGDLREFHAATLTPGAVRGNHCHPDHGEFVSVVGGAAEVVLRVGGRKKRVLLRNASLLIPRGAPHAIVNPGPVAVTVVCFCTPSKKRVERVRAAVA